LRVEGELEAAANAVPTRGVLASEIASPLDEVRSLGEETPSLGSTPSVADSSEAAPSLTDETPTVEAEIASRGQEKELLSTESTKVQSLESTYPVSVGA